jgi:hypothetical protein
VRPIRRLEPGHGARIRATLLCIAALLNACAAPAVKIDRFAAERGFERDVVAGRRYRHVVFRNHLALVRSTLRVYLEGDGTPFVRRTIVARDPTPRQPLMLQLMALDSQRAVYVGRPCYLGLQADAPCGANDWTDARFSAEIVASIAAVIREEMGRAGATSIQLFGHSGGGALAVLLSRDLPVSALVTIAGNLDIDAWTSLHGFTPLTGSLNPADVRLSPALALHTTHLSGADDTSIPDAVIRHAAERIGGEVREVDGYTHQCCWQRLWPSVLLTEARN